MGIYFGCLCTFLLSLLLPHFSLFSLFVS
jgi:hypothetical protein